MKFSIYGRFTSYFDEDLSILLELLFVLWYIDFVNILKRNETVNKLGQRYTTYKHFILMLYRKLKAAANVK